MAVPGPQNFHILKTLILAPGSPQHLQPHWTCLPQLYSKPFNNPKCENLPRQKYQIEQHLASLASSSVYIVAPGRLSTSIDLTADFSFCRRQRKREHATFGVSIVCISRDMWLPK